MNTPDFRARLYEVYRSRFKTGEATDDTRFWNTYDAYCRRRFVRHLAPLDRTLPVLDLGCGQGRLLRILRADGFTQVEGVDAAIEQVQAAQRQQLPVKHGDLFEYLRGQREVYGAILAIDVFEHLSKDELLDLVDLIRDALRPGGILLFQTPNGDGIGSSRIVYGDLTHMTILNRSSATQLLSFAGLEPVGFFETGPLARSAGSTLRAAAWAAIRALAELARRVETRERGGLWSENMIVVARKP